MPSKSLNVLLLIVMLAMDGLILFTLSTPWMRLSLGLALLVPIVMVSSQLGLAETFARMVAIPLRPRRFPALRAKTVALVEEIKRLNWLVVDMDRGFRDPEVVTSEIKASERRLESLLGEVQGAAGQSTTNTDGAGDTPD